MRFPEIMRTDEFLKLSPTAIFRIILSRFLRSIAGAPLIEGETSGGVVPEAKILTSFVIEESRTISPSVDGMDIISLRLVADSPDSRQRYLSENYLVRLLPGWG